MIPEKSAEPVVPGRYEADVNNLSEGVYTCRIYQRAPGENELIETIPFIIPHSSEWKKFGPSHSFLNELAGKTGGALLKSLAASENPKKPPEGAVSSRSQNTLILAIILILILADLIINLPLFRSRG
jgi:hypothetical protein